MKLSAPTGLIFVLSLIVLAVGAVGRLQPDLLVTLPPEVVANSFYFLLGGYGVLAAGVMFKGL
jgi:hypothetical protein